MPNYRRPFQPGGTFFFTVVTNDRRPLFQDAEARQCLREAIRMVQKDRPFEMTAIVLLPEHLHCLWKLPRDEEDLIRHANHIHYNPVKHGLVQCPHAWPHSSFLRWAQEGYYRQDWLCDCGGTRGAPADWLKDGNAFGE